MSRSPTAGNRGNGAKWIRKAKRQRIYSRDSSTCVWCDTQLNCGVPTLDHVLPRSQGGTNDAHNLITCCGLCNSSRGDMTPLQFAVKLGGARYKRRDYGGVRFVNQVLARVLRAIEKPLPELSQREDAQAAE
jgi:5-methylcytosine-specific restriction endonuclease McrA